MGLGWHSKRTKLPSHETIVLCPVWLQLIPTTKQYRLDYFRQAVMFNSLCLVLKLLAEADFKKGDGDN